MRKALLACIALTFSACAESRPQVVAGGSGGMTLVAPPGCDPASAGVPMQVGARRDGSGMAAFIRQSLSWAGTLQDLDTARVLDSYDIIPCPISAVSAWIAPAPQGQPPVPSRRSVPASERVIDGPSARRNMAIGVVRVASLQRCHEYLANLTDVDRDNNFSFGALGTLLGGLGAIFTPTATVRALSGAAGITSGVRAEMNATFFSNQAIGAIRRAIEKRMNDRWEGLAARLAIEDNTQLPYSLAYAEMQSIHGQCAIGAAFAEINAALTRPGPAQPLTRVQILEGRIRERELERRLRDLGGTVPPRPAPAD